ncbi:MAG: hypothetical protein WBI74_12035 [Caldicoprobacterales bacterium]|jgi:hypothetical protein|nr:DNA methylase [Clostridiales bacterium]
MITYAILANPGHNRVYFEAAKKLSLAELEIACKRFSVECSDFTLSEIEGIPYLTFKAEQALDKDDLLWLSRLSLTYALFEIREKGSEIVLKPIRREPSYYFNDDLSTILKYTGKTNELFTRLMINVAILSSDFYNTRDINLLDPVAGKGTTLFESLIAGYNSYGIEISSDVVHEASVYFKKYLENGKYKHTIKRERMRGKDKSFTSSFYRFELAKSKEDFKAGKSLQLCMVAGDSRYSNRFFKKKMFHIIVGDLPYGVQHGNVSRQNQSSITRNPKELLNNCLPGWVESLKSGGVIVLAWNKFVLSREEIIEIFSKHNLDVLNDSPYTEFEHRVDQAINRDIIVAKK